MHTNGLSRYARKLMKLRQHRSPRRLRPTHLSRYARKLRKLEHAVKGRKYVYFEFTDPDSGLRVKFSSRKTAKAELDKTWRLFLGRGLERYGAEAEDVLHHERSAMEMDMTPRELTDLVRSLYAAARLAGFLDARLFLEKAVEALRREVACEARERMLR